MKEQTPLISIIMNCYNSDQFLKEAIDSVYIQIYTNWEIIFWDNASTDNSALIAKSYDERLRYFRVMQNTPLGEARNLAVKKAKGKYIAFLDCDDLYLPDKMEKQVKLMESSKYALCYGSAIIINEKGEEIRRNPVKNRSGYLFGELLNHYEINMQSVMIRSSILTNNQLSFMTNLKYCPDHNLFMEIASRYHVAVVQDFIVKYRKRGDSLSVSSVEIAPSEIQFTLENIEERCPKLKQEFAKEFDHAFKKLNYYYAVAAIYKNDKLQARKELLPVLSSKIQYLILYLLLFLPLSNQNILKILGR
jgi:glycosyltransferase involved in cell wall biosynthesis